MSDWISVEERLPKVGDKVLLYEHDGFLRNICVDLITDYANACLMRDEYDARWDAVTHWMPLPEPPKDGQ